MAVTQIVRTWRFQCPECGFGDVEIGQLAADDDLDCEICLAESGERVRLHRWLPFGEDAPQARADETQPPVAA